MDDLQDAINAIARGDKEKARGFLYAILKEDRNNESAWLLLSQVIDDQQKKIDCIRRALSINPHSGAAYNNLCLLYYRMGQYQKGFKNGRKAIELIEPRTPLKSQAIRYNNLSLCLFALGQTEKAIKYAQKAIVLAPHDLQIQDNLEAYRKKLRRKRRNAVILSFIVLSVIIFVICRLLAPPPSGRKVTRAEFGEDWPFTVEEGYVDCLYISDAVFRANGITYAINGTARSRAQERGYADIYSIWRDDPGYSELDVKVNIGTIIAYALEECD
jgi:tetratricopeptide (TPR) repeat protein